MKLHRYYIGGKELAPVIELNDKALLTQWTKVLRYSTGREVALFNDSRHEALYRIKHISKNTAELTKVVDREPLLPEQEIYLCFSMLKKDKNEWVLQKATELGVSYFVPLISSRTEKTGWNEERAEKIVIEASEQCGRTDVPGIMSPTKLEALEDSLPKDVKLYVAEQGKNISTINEEKIALLIGPEGGWTDEEKDYFEENDIKAVSLSDFTLRAETAAITAAAMLQGGIGV